MKKKPNIRADEHFQEKMSGFIAAQQARVDDRIIKKKPAELRVIEDLRQFHGHYPRETLKKLKARKRSMVHINMTRPRTTALSARLGDLLFPTDERNWAIKPTPVPELAGAAEIIQETALDAKEKQGELAGQAEAEMEAGNLDAAEPLVAEAEEVEELASEADKAADEAQAAMEKARHAAELMQDEINDQLTECDYSIEGRRIIEDGCKTGIGIMKGPVKSYKQTMRWRGASEGDYVLAATEDNAPAAYRVNFFSYFPDPDVRDPSDGEGVYERHLYNAKQMRQMGKEPNVDQDAVRHLLSAAPKNENPDYLVDLSQMGVTDDTQSPKPRYHVWEYSGPVAADELELLAEWFGKDISAYMHEGEIDPLEEISVRLWFCQDKILRFGLYHLDSNESIYSTFVLEPEEEGPWGFGIPYLIRDPAKILNAGHRMQMDNGGVATGPQVVIDRNRIKPMEGGYELEGLKLWEYINDASSTSGVPPFQVFDIDSAQGEIASIIQMASLAIDDVSSMPPIAMGEEGAGVNQTAQGMSLQMNSANVVFRRWVKHYDDGITKQIIRRFYHWNMQFSNKEAIKGDYEVDARGSAVLLVRQTQAQNLIMMAERFGSHPEFGPMHDKRGLMQEIYRAHQVPTDNVLLSNTAWKEAQSKMAEQPSPEVQAAEIMAKQAEADRELRKAEMESKERIAKMETDSRMLVAERSFEEATGQKHQELGAKVAMAELQSADRKAVVGQKDRSLSVEVAEKRRTGEGAGGAI